MREHHDYYLYEDFVFFFVFVFEMDKKINKSHSEKYLHFFQSSFKI
jgi:hypothetical protein